MIFLAVYHRKRRKTSRGEVERRALICYTKADESEAIMKKIKYMAVVLATGLLLAGCEEDETQNNKDAYRQIGINCMQEGDYEGAIDAFQNALDQSLAVVGEEEIDTCYYKAAAQYAAGKKEDAIETYQENCTGKKMTWIKQKKILIWQHSMPAVIMKCILLCTRSVMPQECRPKVRSI